MEILLFIVITFLIVLNLQAFVEFIDNGKMYLFGWSLFFYFDGARLLFKILWVIILIPAEISFIFIYLVPGFIWRKIKWMFVRKKT